jgi:excisionase family DNA binding protein
MVDRLRADGEWVNSHLSTVAAPVAGRYLGNRRAPVQLQPDHPTPIEQPADRHLAAPSAAEPHSARRLPFRRRPGPSPLTMRQSAIDEYDDPVEDLRYKSEITTRDAADLLGVTQATVRRWVARGHISPVGKFGAANLFNTRDVLDAYDHIQAKHKATGRARREHRYRVELRPVDRVRPKHYDAVVAIGEAARSIGVSPSTIRSWIHRGHLIPLGSSEHRAVRLRLGDVIAAAQSRQLPGRVVRPRRGRPRSGD